MDFYNWGGCVTIPRKMDRPHLLLASQSPRRRELLQLLGLPFEVAVADVDEEPRADETPAQLVTRLSRAKARGVTFDGPRSALVIACDTIVALEDGYRESEILGKPRDPEEAAAMLRRLRGCRHVVYSGLTVLTGDGRASTKLAETHLRMRPYTDSEIEAYVATGDPLDKAGSYAIQHAGFDPVESVEGCYASVMGLPLCHLARCLRRRGRPPAGDVPSACEAHTGHRCTVYQEFLGS